jgi:hypothetical protein
VSPAIENDSRDVGFGIESRAREHVGELLSELALVFAERKRKQLRASPVGLSGVDTKFELTSTVFFSRGDGLLGGDGI